MKYSYEFSFYTNDKRRVNLTGTDKRTLTGIDARAFAVSSADCEETCLTKAMRYVADDDTTDDDSDGDDPVEAAEPDAPPLVKSGAALPMGTTIYMGWRCSWRKFEVEVQNREKILAKFNRMQKHYQHVDMPKAVRQGHIQTADDRHATQQRQHQNQCFETQLYAGIKKEAKLRKDG